MSDRLLPAFVEGLIFWGVIQCAATEVLGRWAWVYAAGLMAILHLGSESIGYWLLVLAVALYLGWMVKRTESLGGAVLSLAVANVITYLAMPLLV